MKIGIKDYIYIGIIILIIIYYNVIKKIEQFTTTDEDISLTESIKNLGIIANDLIQNDTITIPGNLVLSEGGIVYDKINTVDKIIDFI
jgi:hypothetical protein